MITLQTDVMETIGTQVNTFKQVKVIRVNFMDNFIEFSRIHDDRDIDEIIYQNMTKLELYYICLEVWLGVLTDSTYNDVKHVPLEETFLMLLNYELGMVLNIELEEDMIYVDNPLLDCVQNKLSEVLHDIDISEHVFIITGYRSIKECLLVDIEVGKGHMGY